MTNGSLFFGGSATGLSATNDVGDEENVRLTETHSEIYCAAALWIVLRGPPGGVPSEHLQQQKQDEQDHGTGNREAANAFKPPHGGGGLLV